ncbi:MAG: pyridoxamine 5'-phosphate oxidase family protein [Actinobacteria bacterium]|nr:pyridoxamine 5'-phosphate oxidase family protein [Actinomycetota bacterium]
MTAPIGERPAMADYGVNVPEWAPLPWSWAAERLIATRNYWLVTVGTDGQPHSLPVWGVWDETDRQFMFSCSPTAKKARNIAANPLVSFTNDDSVECVSVQGAATRMSEASRIDTWVDRYLDKYGKEMGPEAGSFIREHSCFEVTPTLAISVIERADEFATRATRWRFVGSDS